MKWFFALLPLLFLAVRGEAQTFLAQSQQYPLSFYTDSDGYRASSAVSELGVPAEDSRSFRIRVYSKRRAVYADSWGSRLPCSIAAGSIRCTEQASFNDELTGMQCTISVAYAISGSRRGGFWHVLFKEDTQCVDGWYRSLEYSGRVRVRALANG